MRALLAVLGVIGLVIVAAGAINHAATIRLDYLLGTAGPVSLFWPFLVIAAIIVLAGVIGIATGRSASGDDRRKLEAELEDTYRRLRAAQAEAERGASTATPPEPVTQIGAEAAEPATVVAPVLGGAAEPATALVPLPAEAETVITPPDELPGTVAVAPPTAPEAGAAPEGSTLAPGGEPAVHEAGGDEAQTVRARGSDPQTGSPEAATDPDATGPA